MPRAPKGLPVPPPDHYGALNLRRSKPDNQYTEQAIKRAYRAALLTYHPEAAIELLPVHVYWPKPPPRPRDSSASHPTVAAIADACRVLKHPRRRADYNVRRSAYNCRRLAYESHHSTLAAADAARAAAERTAGTVDRIETLDLSFLENEGLVDSDTHWAACSRCGEARGFEITDEELRSAAEEAECEDDEEVTLGCTGCGRWICVSFRVNEIPESPETPGEPAEDEGSEGASDLGHGSRALLAECGGLVLAGWAN